jgi:hypothetical protein
MKYLDNLKEVFTRCQGEPSCLIGHVEEPDVAIGGGQYVWGWCYFSAHGTTSHSAKVVQE